MCHEEVLHEHEKSEADQKFEKTKLQEAEVDKTLANAHSETSSTDPYEVRSIKHAPAKCMNNVEVPIESKEDNEAEHDKAIGIIQHEGDINEKHRSQDSPDQRIAEENVGKATQSKNSTNCGKGKGQPLKADHRIHESTDANILMSDVHHSNQQDTDKQDKTVTSVCEKEQVETRGPRDKKHMN